VQRRVADYVIVRRTLDGDDRALEVLSCMQLDDYRS
jgi:hypothetical protein